MSKAKRLAISSAVYKRAARAGFRASAISPLLFKRGQGAFLCVISLHFPISANLNFDKEGRGKRRESKLSLPDLSIFALKTRRERERSRLTAGEGRRKKCMPEMTAASVEDRVLIFRDSYCQLGFFFLFFFLGK